jgi:hypothetical protein
METIAIVVPSNRPEKLEVFKKAWASQIVKHNSYLIIVDDSGKLPVVKFDRDYSLKEIMGKYSDVIFNKSDTVRNLGFAFVYKYLPEVNYIISLDDDTLPYGDTLGDHIKALKGTYRTDFINTINDIPVRGMPYLGKKEAWVSHGVWVGSPDLDAPHQLVLGERHEYTWYKGVVPKGVKYPACIMNMMFKREALPFMYQYPMNTHGFDRFADMWGGLNCKENCDKLDKATVTGFAVVKHDRASDPFKNIIKEAKGLGIHEQRVNNDFSHEYFTLANEKFNRWLKFIK